MASAGRESYNLATRWGWRHFLRDLFRRRRFTRLMWRDTFGPVLCWLAGDHVIQQSFDNGEVQSWCSCCYRWLKQDGYRWVKL